MTKLVKHRAVDVRGHRVDVFAVGEPRAPLVAAAHPSDAFGAPTAALLARLSGGPAVCIDASPAPDGDVATDELARMVDRIEAARVELALPPWIFWGMSGGGWLALLYARRHRAGLAGIVIESACASFRARLQDPACAISPRFDAWRGPLSDAGLLDGDVPEQIARVAWQQVDGAGQVARIPDGPAVLVAPEPLTPATMRALPAMLAFDARPWLDQLDVPALVLCGTADPIVPVSRVRAVHEALAGSTFVAIEGAGHVPTAQSHPEAVRAFEAFRSSLPG